MSNNANRSPKFLFSFETFALLFFCRKMSRREYLKKREENSSTYYGNRPTSTNIDSDVVWIRRMNTSSSFYMFVVHLD